MEHIQYQTPLEMSSAASLPQLLEDLRLSEDSQAPTSTADSTSANVRNIQTTIAQPPCVTTAPTAVLSAPMEPTPMAPLPGNYVPIISTSDSNIFHLFSGRCKYLRPLYSSQGKRLFPAITNLLLKRQIAHNPTIKLDLNESTLWHSSICDPIILDPYPLVLFDSKDGVDVEFLEHEGAHKSVINGSGKGFESILLVGEQDEEYSTVESSWGSFKMRRVWKNEGSTEKELFACWLELSIRYEEWASRIRLGDEDEDEGREDEYECFFWAIRSEIGSDS